jgi:hypothetical protein
MNRSGPFKKKLENSEGGYIEFLEMPLYDCEDCHYNYFIAKLHGKTCFSKRMNKNQGRFSETRDTVLFN